MHKFLFCSKDYELLDHMEWIHYTLKVHEEMPPSLSEVSFSRFCNVSNNNTKISWEIEMYIHFIKFVLC